MFTAMGTILTIAGTLTWQASFADLDQCHEHVDDLIAYVDSMNGTLDTDGCVEVYGPPRETFSETFTTPMGTTISWVDFYLISFRN